MPLLKICLLGILLCHAYASFTQETKYQSISKLSVGAPLHTSFEQASIFNTPVSKIQLSSIPGKAVIIDFFATWCAPCVASLYHLNEYQDNYNDNLQIVLVTDQPNQAIASFLSKNKSLASTRLLFIVSDTLLRQSFPYNSIPHSVFLDKQRIVKSITSGDQINDRNIVNLLDGKDLNLRQKNDLLEYDKNKTLAENFSNDSFLEGSSAVYKYIEGLPAGTFMNYNSDSTVKRIAYTSEPIITLYLIATRWLHLPNRVVLEVDNINHFIRKKDTSWREWGIQNGYSYEILVPGNFSDVDLSTRMQADLDFYLNLHGRLEYRMVNCFALVQGRKGYKRLTSQVRGEVSGPAGSSNGRTIIKNETVETFVNTLNYQIPSLPLKSIVLDETHLRTKINMSLDIADLNDLSQVARVIKPYGLQLLPVKRKLKMLVISNQKL